MLTHVRRSQNRFELKYLLSTRQVEGFVRSLEPYLRTDANAEARRGYPVHSVYWDSDEWTLFWEKIEGLKDRRKLRVRRYSGVDYAFIEIKHRTDRTLQKRRTKLPLETVYRAFRAADSRPDDVVDIDDPVVREAMYLRHRHRLRPRMAVGYRRRAFFGRFEPDLRITVDTRVQYHATETDIAGPFENGEYVVDPRVAILEIKFNDQVPDWLVRQVSAHGLEMTRMSKFCTAVDRAFFGNRLT
ncbi:MAG: polyphosphate polymerase domain-containing protein [Gemmatimonadota bacterium]|nr:polyphosphate polymerase domain-containing protein [Gemmatimonadota bacterium]